MIKHLQITGRVQGVGYRINFQHIARTLGLSGWVRNRRDGSVEALISGDVQPLQKLIDWAKQGPTGAQVIAVAVEDVADESVAEGLTEGLFDVHPTP